MSRQRSHAAGLTMVEVLVALAISMLLLVLMLRVFSDMRSATAVQQLLAGAQGEAGVALNLMVRDMRSAGGWGCRPRRVMISGIDENDPWLRYSRPVEGWPGSAMPPVLSPATLTPLPDSTVIAVRGRAGESMPVLTADEDIVIAETRREQTGCSGEARFNGLCPGDPVAITHCGGGRISLIDSITPFSQDGADYLRLTLDPPPELVDPHTRLIPVRTRVYFMAQRRDGSIGLFRRDNAGRSQEVADGNHRLHATFAATLQETDDFIPAAEITDWSSITATRLTLEWGDEVADGGISPLTTTIAIRNRLP